MKPEESRLLIITIIALLLLLSIDAVAKSASAGKGKDVLELDEYLTQVSQQHLGLKAAVQISRSARLHSREGSLVYKPVLVGGAQESADARNNPRSRGDYLSGQNYSIGISEQTPIGLAAKISYNSMGLQAPASPGLMQPASSYGVTWGQIELSLSLFRNLFGSETRAQARAIESAALAKSYLQSFHSKGLLLEAETGYWHLALARELVSVQLEGVARARRIYEWTSRRLKMKLTDQTEMLQASTNLNARELDLQVARDEERAAANAFNSARGIQSDKADEKLADLGPELVARLTVPERKGDRDDVVAADHRAKAEAASSIIAREKNKPTIEIFGTGLFNDPSPPSQTMSAMLPLSARPSSMVGVRLVAPLDVFSSYKAVEGHSGEALAADWIYRRKAFETERAWHDLNAKFRESRTRLKLFTDLEKTQREKADFERDKQQRGRSTMQQVLIFETDYQTSQVGRIRTLAEILMLHAQLKTYGASYESR